VRGEAKNKGEALEKKPARHSKKKSATGP